MRKILIMLAAIVAISGTGCTAAQITEADSVVHTGVVDAENAVVALESNEGTIDNAEAKLAALAPQNATIAKAIGDAQTAMAAFKNNQGTIDSVLSALAIVDQLTAPNPNATAAIRRPRKKAPPATKPQ
jgi:hypothetical protein